MKLEIKNLSFSYKNKEILNNISFEVYSGTLLSILGANGAGKTTLIKCINGILNFKKGEVLIDEKNFNNKSLKEKSKIMSYVPQITSSFDIDLTVFDTVLLGRVPHKTFKFSEWDKQIALNAIKEERIKYSGSPMAYSFSEATQTKGMRLVELTKEIFTEEFISLEQKRKLHNISTTYEEVFTKVFQQNFDCKNDYFNMELSGMEGVTDPLPRIKEYYPNTLILKQKRNNNSDSEIKFDKEMLTKSPLELIEGFYNEQTGSELTVGQKRVLVNIIDKVNQDETN